MAAHSTIQATRQSKYSWLASITGIGTLSTTILEGLGVFGLAANGMCPSLSVQAVSSLAQAAPKVANEPRQ
jgi:hypothetical protein